LDRAAQGPRQFLGEFDGILQTDGYAGYGKVGGKNMVHAGCWVHARRYFFQAVQLNGKDLVALGIVAEIDKLFELGADAKAASLGAAERFELRGQKAQPIVEALKGRVESARASALPRSALGKACDYTLGRWGQLRRFLDYAQIELSNNLAENANRRRQSDAAMKQPGIRQSLRTPKPKNSHLYCAAVGRTLAKCGEHRALTLAKCKACIPFLTKFRNQSFKSCGSAN
jgi:hypothetical protein